MKSQLEARLNELRDEYDAGTKVLADLQKKQDELRSTLLRISGAIQVLEEVLAAETTADAEANGPRLVAN
jgi:DNA repair exonuclease SbcCD ATPase subunit